MSEHPHPLAGEERPELRSVFPGDGEMARLCRSLDWAATPLGPVESWPKSLRTLVRTLLTSRFPMALWWGEQSIQIYNDAYRPSLGTVGAGALHPEALAIPAYECWAEVWDEVVKPQIDRILATGEATWHEDQRVPLTRDGILADSWWTYSYGPAHDDEGRVVGVLVVTQETTPRVRAESGVRELADRLSTTLESITDALFTLDREWRFVFLNSEAERLLNRDRSDLLGVSIWDAFPDAVDGPFEACYREAMTTGRTQHLVAFYEPLGRWFSVRAYPSEEGLAVYFLDVSEQRRMEADLGEREQLLTMAGRMARVGGWTLDLETNRLRWSDEVCRIHGVPPGTELTPEEAFAFFPDEWRGRAQAAHRRYIEGGHPTDEEVQIERGDGERIWVRIMAEPVRAEDGRIVRVQGIVQDIQAHKEAESALRWSDRRFRLLAESMPLIVWSADDEGRVDFNSGMIEEFTGVSAKELHGEGWFDVVHPDDRARAAEVWRRSVEAGEPYSVEFRIRRHDGSWQWHLTRGQPVLGEDGRPIRWYGSSTNIHQQIRDREEAERAREKLTVTLESITDAFYLLDPDWRFSFLNEEAEQLLERSRDKLLGRPVWNEFPETVGSVLEREYRAAMDTGETAAFTFFYAPLDRWFAVKGYPSVEGLAVYFRDVSKEIQANRRLEEQAELLDRAQDAILVLDREGTIIFWNAGAERIYGWGRDEVLGQSFRSLLHTAFDTVDSALTRVTAEGDWTGELEQRRRDSSTIAVEGRWSLVRIENGEPHRILAIHTDITERKRLLAQFLRAQRMESIGTLAGGIAHDLNNVLAPILLSIEMLKMESEDPDILETLTTIESSAQRGADMVKQVLGFARGFDRTERVVDIRRVVSDLERVIRDAFPKSIEIRVEAPDGLWPVLADPTQLHQVLMNLAVNARDALPQGGTVRIALDNVVLDEHYATMSGEAEPGPHVRISVVDSGVGMSKQVMDQIFDPFFTTKEVGKGTGLGLSTVAAIVKAHGGFINVYSEPGNGTTFRLYFPAREEGDGEESGSAEIELLRGDGEVILVVDDESSVREITKQTLQTFGYRVITARDGADAVAIYAQRGEEIDLVLTDMVMPIMDGPATIRALKRMDADVRIIAASGLGTNGGVARIVDSGIRHFLPKPYTADTLLEVIHRVLREEA
ncbi:MAG: PAS domain S-box protein [Gemmatimonadales bacterium]|nr:MAG: PAS domain S-box protein [Gemmatimonadales bacterium]